MKLALKIAAAVLLLLVTVVASFVAYISLTWDKDYSAIEKPAVQASQDPEVIKRGEYLAHSVSHCSVCHVASMEVTLKRQSGEHPAMSGGFKWQMGPLGTLYSRNITPDPDTGIGKWTDGELARAIKWGVGRDGKLLGFMSMAAPAMSDEDVTAVVSYLRSTPAVRLENKPHEPGIVFKWLSTKLGPDFRKPWVEGLKHQAAADQPSVERGMYLARGPAWCVGCHTPLDMMTMELGPLFSGSDQAEPDSKSPGMVFRMPNLTPDPETGHIANWDEDHFLARFRAGRAIEGSKMPWEAYREMTDSDLRSIFRYLKSLPPTRHYIGPSYRKASEDPSKDGTTASR